ncbi:MAG: peptidylprolyl isomerase, partial [Actinomycetota bacterium]|nr:peptidylprolyl isomerase [Actinomycetota bacterium]
NKRARDRQLAKLAARRQAERRRQQRRRSRIVGAISVVAVIGLGATAFAMLTDDGSPKASATPTPSSSTTEDLCKGKAPKAAGEKKSTFDKAPPMTIDPKATYIATMKTSCGTVEMELYPDVAPIGVNSFVFLARQGFYDGLTFHRIVADFVIQGGDPTGDGTGGPGYQFDNEVSKKVTFDDGGILAYANSGPGTNGSQFFITLAPAPNLDPTPSASYTIFGKVTKGMDVVQHIGALPTTAPPGSNEASLPTQPVYIDSITIEERT